MTTFNAVDDYVFVCVVSSPIVVLVFRLLVNSEIVDLFSPRLIITLLKVLCSFCSGRQNSFHHFL